MNNETFSENRQLDNPDEGEEGDIFDDEKIEPVQYSNKRQWLRSAIAFLFFLGIIFLWGGVRDIFMFRETPESSTVPELSAVVEAEEIKVPLSVVAVVGEDEEQRPKSELETEMDRLVDNASSIWKQQANISFILESVESQVVERESIFDIMRQPAQFVAERSPETSAPLTIVITQSLGGINGVAFRGEQTAFVAEYTTYFDYRVLAHEIGHLLGLGHSQSRSNIMYQGSAGLLLTSDQAGEARAVADNLVNP